jgi:hypothetical protein
VAEDGHFRVMDDWPICSDDTDWVALTRSSRFESLSDWF